MIRTTPLANRLLSTGPTRLLALLLVLLSFGCHTLPPDPEVVALRGDLGRTFYTRASVFQEKDVYRTTNYRRGLLVPVNTEVTLISIDARQAIVDLTDGHTRLTVQNVPQHTGESMGEAFHTLFAEQPVDLSRFSESERSAILAGRAEVGMDKDTVLIALGHPPATLTPSLDASQWLYQDTRWTKFAVTFGADGRVTAVGR